MNYPLYNLDDEEFEGLVASICEEILGIATIIFSSGKDGGRDAKFTGRANKFPSESKPWEGKFIIQAKHTTKLNASCSDHDFNKKILKDEVEKKLSELKRANKVDYYLLFTNRKLSGIQDAKIEDFLDKQTGVENCILGEERIQKWLKDYPQIARRHCLNRLLLPLEFYEDDLKNIIEVFSKTQISPEEIQKTQKRINRIPIEEKNKLNELSGSYFKNVLKKSYSEFDKITTFLSDPRNGEFRTYYENTVADLQDKILIKRSEYATFDEIIHYLYEYVLRNNLHILKDKRNLIRVFLHYMYHNCDIGIDE